VTSREIKRPHVLIIFLSMLVVSATSAKEARRNVPDKAALKTRVDQLYKAWHDRNQKAMFEVILPQLLRCSPPLPGEDIFKNWDREEPLQIMSWKVQEIRYDGHYANQTTEWCSGQTFYATAGAHVFIAQTDKKPGEEPEEGVLVLPWVYVEGSWYTLLDDD